MKYFVLNVKIKYKLLFTFSFYLSLMQQYPNANKQLTEDNFEGNICRCTGE